MSRLTFTANSALLATLLSHLLCCGLPALVNLLALFAGVGFFSAMVPWVGWLHDSLHQYELAILVISAIALAFGFWAHQASASRDCSETSCNHEPCAPKKRQSKIILIVASVLFVINTGNYLWHNGLLV